MKCDIYRAQLNDFSPAETISSIGHVRHSTVTNLTLLRRRQPKLITSKSI